MKPWYRSWPAKVPKSIKYPEIPLWKFLQNSAILKPARTATIFHGAEMSYGRLWELSERFAAALSEDGVKKGDIIAIMLPNCPQFIISSHGVLRIGGIITLLSPLLSKREALYQMDDSGAETLITSDALWVQKMRKVAERIKRIILARPLDYTPKEQPPREYPGTMDFRKMVESHKPEPPEVKFEPKEDVAILGYTGGTTGLPKGVILTHWNRVVNTLQGASWYAPVVGEEFSSEPALEDLPREPPETGIAVTPWCHAMGFSGLSTRLAVAATAIILPEFDPRKYLELIQKYKPRGVGGVPTLFNFLLSHPDFDKYDVSSIKFCVSGAAPLPVETYKEIEKKFDAIVIEGYGLTEATAAAIINPADPDGKRKPGSVGLPLPDTDVKIVDVERGERELPPGEIGELIIKGPQVMLGYWKREEETKKALRNGWLYTGDLARMDEDGYFYIVERKKEMLIYKGYNVYPRELEEVLYEHPAVKLCAVIGKPDPKVGEIPKAFVVLKRGKKVTAEELMRFCEERVASYKKIREVEFRSSLPLSFIGKVLKRELQKEENAKR